MWNDPRINNLARMLDVAVLRGQVHAGNLANQNTPGYRARAVDFEERFTSALDRQDDASTTTPTVYEPRDTGMDNDGNDVSSQREIAALAKNQVVYNAGTAILRGKLRLYQTALTQTGG
jgi:flagellar basal-body rod protein FlgB